MPGKVHPTRDGDGLQVESGGLLQVDAGGRVTLGSGVGIAGVAEGYRIARGEVTLDGSNPTSVTTGLATIVAAVACFKSAVVLGDDPNSVTVDYGGSVAAGQLDIYAGKNATGTDPTQIASTSSTAVVSWMAIGT